MLFIALPIVILIFISKYVKKKISIHSSTAVELRTVFGRNINLLLSSLPDLMISVNNYKDSILQKNINDMSLSYNKLFFTKEYFSYFVENFYLLIFFLIILIIDILFTKPVSNLISPIIIFLVISLRLIPSINRIFGQIGLLTYGLKSLHQVSKYFNSKINLTKIKLIKNDIVIVKFSKNFKFFNKIKFRRKYFFDPGINVIKGANGSGKTTLLQIIFGINVGSKVVVYRNGAVGYLGQSYTCLNNKVSEELFFLTKNNNNLKETSSFTKKILLSSKIRMHDKIDNLSGGQRQLLSFCKIINQNPKIIILDEPLSSLDKKNIKYFIKILNYWKYNKKILIISDHTNIIKADRLVNI
jgi:energy-coupling factor transporter ATP-binding protein EcfA2